MDLILLGTRALFIALGPLLYVSTTSMVMHEAEVRYDVGAHPRPEATSQ